MLQFITQIYPLKIYTYCKKGTFGMDSKKRCAKIIRTVTVAPVMAGVLLTALFLLKPEVFGRPLNYGCGIMFLTVLPILAYPLQKFMPGYRNEGREGQRNLAMAFAVGGYILGCAVTLFLNAPSSMWIIYLEYLCSGILIALVNKVFHFKASGHACGVAGPVALLFFFGVPVLFPGIVFLALTWWASLYIKRHTIAQLAGGCAIPVLVLFMLHFIFR